MPVLVSRSAIIRRRSLVRLLVWLLDLQTLVVAIEHIDCLYQAGRSETAPQACADIDRHDTCATKAGTGIEPLDEGLTALNRRYEFVGCLEQSTAWPEKSSTARGEGAATGM
ncbi:hypothetical protein [Micromonospora chersina]|uniref:hypothetical protein n=1 Tax=Micromonospora chersina TaxID=47854 RepID=UPI0033C062EF